ncbi:hypothetical protein GUJ93_ZPchr0006g41823 [Zizania palustris]|uniref:Gluconokinase n=1 Tax=Zizania palustris TaxID=103762 RepID=A0A8J5SYI0_ZIZPA|nr:hypothetical protein GUJ93_ZPchr0006g41823 [Zizania palustris]
MSKSYFSSSPDAFTQGHVTGFFFLDHSANPTSASGLLSSLESKGCERLSNSCDENLSFMGFKSPWNASSVSWVSLRLKFTVAALLAETLGCSFVEADDYHSQANKAKMTKGIPLTDGDRIPWLESLRDAIRERLDRGEDVAVSCSALQQKYREILREGDFRYSSRNYSSCRVKFVCLKASAEVIAERMRRRSMEGEHFMPASLLQSQLDLLQINKVEGITEVDATVRPVAIVHDTIAQFRTELASTA